MKLKVGTIYKYSALGEGAAKMECLLSTEKSFVLRNLDNGGEHLYNVSYSDKYDEYKEPVTHRRDVVWYKDNDTVSPCFRKVGESLWTIDSFDISHPELHRQTVEYTEK